MEAKLQAQKIAIIAEDSIDNREVTDLMNKVTAKVLNSKEEFLTFAGKAESRTLADLCTEVRHHRDRLALALQHAVSALGHEPVTDENFVGWLHHGWVRARLAIEGSNDHVITSEAAREEDSMRNVYEEALECDSLPTDVRTLFQLEMERSHELTKMFRSIKDELKPDEYVDLNKD